MWTEILHRARANDATVRYSQKKQAPHFAYVDARGREHIVWFENARSIAAKRSIVREIGVSGMHYWRLGGKTPRSGQRADESAQGFNVHLPAGETSVTGRSGAPVTQGRSSAALPRGYHQRGGNAGNQQCRHENREDVDLK